MTTASLALDRPARPVLVAVADGREPPVPLDPEKRPSPSNCHHLAMDEVVELDVPWIPDPGAPTPRLAAVEGHCRVIYRPASVAPTEMPLAVLEFLGCEAVKFGHPNDEALPGHPLYAKGLRYYSVLEVLESSWSAELHEHNLVPFPHSTSWRGDRRHFVVTFHDSTLECLATAIRGRFASDLNDAVAKHPDSDWRPWHERHLP